MQHNDFDFICDQFLQHGKIFKNFQPATLNGYRHCFRLLVKMTGVEKIEHLSPDIIERFLYDGRITRKWSVCTFRTYHKQLRAFCNWCVKKKLISHNYTDSIEKPPQERRIPKYLSPERCEEILEVAYHLDYYCKMEGVRNRALLGIMIFAGLRLSEIANLKRLDIDFKTETITVRQGKWNKDRQIPISSRLMFFLMEYVNAKGKKPSQHIHFFSSVKNDAPLKPRGIQLVCRRIKEASGIAFSPQMLRHTFATLTYQGSRDIYAVSGLLGHAKVETTQIYAALSLDDKRNSVERHVMNTLC